MNTIAEFILEEFNFVNSLIKPENRHNTQLMKGILSYIEVLELLAVANFIYQEEQEKKERSKRRVWVWPYLQRRLEHGHYENLMQELARECPQLYRIMLVLFRRRFRGCGCCSPPGGAGTGSSISMSSSSVSPSSSTTSSMTSAPSSRLITT